MGLDGMDRSHLAESRDSGWAVVSTVMNPRFHKMQGIS